MITFTTFVILTLFCLEFCIKKTTCSFCEPAWSCEKATLEAGEVFCRGYKSCFNCESITATSSGITCGAGYSCKESGYIFADNFIYCLGTASCANTNYVEVNDSQISCDGSSSCQHSSLIAISNDINCWGEYSCYGSNLTAARNIHFWGSYSGVNSLITSTLTDTEFCINFYGYFAGYNTTIICNDGYECEINCFGNGCVNSFIACHDNSTCEINGPNSDVNCSFDKSNYNYNYNNRNLECPIIFDINDYLNGIDWKSKYYNYNNTNIIEIEYPNNDWSLTSIANLQTNNESCSTNTNNNYFCADFAACANSIISTNQNGTESSVICCIGDDSCRWSSIRTNIDNQMGVKHQIFCTSYYSCNDAIISYSSNSNNSYTKIAGTEIYCQAYRSCSKLELNDGSSISVDYLQCSGDSACVDGNIFNVDVIICSGCYACSNTILTDVTSVYATGETSLAGSTIIARNGSGIVMNISFLGWKAGYETQAKYETQIICGIGNECNIKCGVYGSCYYSKTTIICYSNECNVECLFSDNSICPRVINRYHSIASLITTLDAIDTINQTNSNYKNHNFTTGGGENTIFNTEMVTFILIGVGMVFIICVIGCLVYNYSKFKSKLKLKSKLKSSLDKRYAKPPKFKDIDSASQHRRYTRCEGEEKSNNTHTPRTPGRPKTPGRGKRSDDNHDQDYDRGRTKMSFGIDNDALLSQRGDKNSEIEIMDSDSNTNNNNNINNKHKKYDESKMNGVKSGQLSPNINIGAQNVGSVSPSQTYHSPEMKMSQINLAASLSVANEEYYNLDIEGSPIPSSNDEKNSDDSCSSNSNASNEAMYEVSTSKKESNQLSTPSFSSVNINVTNGKSRQKIRRKSRNRRKKSKLKRKGKNKHYHGTRGYSSTDKMSNDYRIWTQTDVLNWIKMRLIEKNISGDVIDSFLKEFETKCVSGAMLDDFGADKHLLNDLKRDFSPQNQAFGVWMVITQSIKQLRAGVAQEGK